MSLLNRRQSLKALLGNLLEAAGTVVLATAVLPAHGEPGKTAAPAEDATQAAERELEERANQVAEAQGFRPAEETQEYCAFFNSGFANSGFRKGGWVNGGFTNGGFRKGGWVNGGWTNAGFPRP